MRRLSARSYSDSGDRFAISSMAPLGVFGRTPLAGVGLGTGRPRDKDEVKQREIRESDERAHDPDTVSYTHLTLPTIYSV